MSVVVVVDVVAVAVVVKSRLPSVHLAWRVLSKESTTAAEHPAGQGVSLERVPPASWIVVQSRDPFSAG